MPAEPGSVLVVGEALVDVVEGTVTPGGSPANVAVGLVRLGVPVELTSRLGTDTYGVLLAQHLANNGVRLSTGTVDPTARTATATASLDDKGTATYHFEIDWRPPALRLPDDCVAVHTGSIATVLAPGADDVGGFVRSLATAPVTVCLDPNVRPSVTPDPAAAWAVATELAAYADVVKLSEQDCRFLRPDSTPRRVAVDLLAADRTRCVLVTLGPDGALAVTASRTTQVPAPRVEVVDTVGAGDAFMAALIAGLHRRNLLGPARLSGVDAHLADLLSTAVRAAALTCARPGADPPSAAELARDDTDGWEAHSGQRR